MNSSHTNALMLFLETRFIMSTRSEVKCTADACVASEPRVYPVEGIGVVMRLLAWLSATSAFQPVSDLPSLISRAYKVSCISHIVVALEFAIPVRQSEDHEQKQCDDPPVACRRGCAILHPPTQTHLTNTSLKGIRLWTSFFPVCSFGAVLQCCIATASISSHNLHYCCFGLHGVETEAHLLLHDDAISHRNGISSSEDSYVTCCACYELGSESWYAGRDARHIDPEKDPLEP